MICCKGRNTFVDGGAYSRVMRWRGRREYSLNLSIRPHSASQEDFLQHTDEVRNEQEDVLLLVGRLVDFFNCSIQSCMTICWDLAVHGGNRFHHLLLSGPNGGHCLGPKRTDSSRGKVGFSSLSLGREEVIS